MTGNYTSEMSPKWRHKMVTFMSETVSAQQRERSPKLATFLMEPCMSPDEWNGPQEETDHQETINPLDSDHVLFENETSLLRIKFDLFSDLHIIIKKLLTYWPSYVAVFYRSLQPG